MSFCKNLIPGWLAKDNGSYLCISSKYFVISLVIPYFTSVLTVCGFSLFNICCFNKKPAPRVEAINFAVLPKSAKALLAYTDGSLPITTPPNSSKTFKPNLTTAPAVPKKPVLSKSTLSIPH